jgi:hypothetical protein
MFDRDTLWNYVYFALEKEWPDAHKSKVEGATDRICDAVGEWLPKHGDFWLNESDGMLYVNRGWEVVTVGAFE